MTKLTTAIIETETHDEAQLGYSQENPGSV